MNETQRQAKHFVERFRSIFADIAEMQADLKEIAKEAKSEGFDAALLKRWAKALADDKGGKLAFTLMEMTTIGQTVAPTLFDVLPEADDETTEEEDAVAIAKGSRAARRQMKRLADEMFPKPGSGIDSVMISVPGRDGIKLNADRTVETVPAHDPETGEITESAAAPAGPASDVVPTPSTPATVAPAAEPDDDEPKVSLQVAELACSVARLSVTDPAGAKAVVDTVEALARENRRTAGLSAGRAPTQASVDDFDLKAGMPPFLRRGWA